MIIGGWVVWTGAALQVLAGGLLVFPLVLEGVRQLRKRKWGLPVRVSNQEVDIGSNCKDIAIELAKNNL